MADTSDGRHRPPITARAMDTVVIIVSLTWGASFVADIWVQNYDPPTGLHQIMMLIIGFVVAGRSQVGKDGEGKDEAEEKKP